MPKKNKDGDKPGGIIKRTTRGDILARVLELQHAAMLVLCMELKGSSAIKVDNLNNEVRSLLDSYWDK